MKAPGGMVVSATVLVFAGSFQKRKITGPVTTEPSAFFATGTWTVSLPLLANGTTSPCQPLHSSV